MPLAQRSTAARERFPLRGEKMAAAAGVDPGALAAKPACICHDGYSGDGCETADARMCFNRCSDHGACVGRFCLCDRGWRGLDCSIGQPAAPPPTSPSRFAPMYVYPLPTDFSLEGVYQRDQLRRGQYYANLMFTEQLHSRKDAIVSDPEEAALFFVPVMVMQMVS